MYYEPFLSTEGPMEALRKTGYSVSSMKDAQLHMKLKIFKFRVKKHGSFETLTYCVSVVTE